MIRVEQENGLSDGVVHCGGTPGWITPDLIQDTIDTWQPYYQERLTTTDAIEILQSVGRLCDVLAGSP